MAIESHLADQKTGKTVRVVAGSALAVNPPHPSLSFNAELGTDDVPVNVIPAKANHAFCLTGIFLTSNKNVDPNTAATVQIYTGDSETTAASDALTTILSAPVPKNDQRDYNPILVEAEEGKWINGVTSDDDVFVTIMGYYLKVS
jgi:hypothetical protein